MTAQKSSKSSGQALLIIILVMAVGLTVGLSIISRSVTDIRISRQEEEAARALSGAEAGIEDALRTPLAVGEPPRKGTVGDITYTVEAIGQGSGPVFDFGGSEFPSGVSESVWLIEHNGDGSLNPAQPYTGTTLDIYWGKETEDPSSLTTPALEVISICLEGNTYKIVRGAFDGYSGSNGDRNNNNFSDANVGPYEIGGRRYAYRKTSFDLKPSLPNCSPYLLRLKLLYNNQSQPLAVNGGVNNVPPQGKCYVASAQVPGSQATRRVQQCQFFPAPPSVLDYVMFSQGSIVK